MNVWRLLRETRVRRMWPDEGIDHSCVGGGVNLDEGGKARMFTTMSKVGQVRRRGAKS